MLVRKREMLEVALEVLGLTGRVRGGRIVFINLKRNQWLHPCMYICGDFFTYAQSMYPSLRASVKYLRSLSSPALTGPVGDAESRQYRVSSRAKLRNLASISAS